jgi:hypothetical protein
MDLDKTFANSHTHCQAAQVNIKTQAWQRVCLPNRTGTLNSTQQHFDTEKAS